MGRRPHQPTSETRAQVSALVVAGIPHDRICKIIGVSLPTLLKHYRDELDHGLDIKVNEIAETLVQKALSGDNTAMIFFLKTRGRLYGWQERREVSGPDGGPIQTEDMTADAEAFTRRITGLAAACGEDEASGEPEPGGEG